MEKAKNNFATIKGMPIEKATSFEPSEIKGIKPNVKLSKDGHNLGTATQTYKG